MFGHQYHRFLCIVAAALHASTFQSTLLTQVDAIGSATHYRSLAAHYNIEDKRLIILGTGSDPEDRAKIAKCKTNSIETYPPADNIKIYSHSTASKFLDYEISNDYTVSTSTEDIDVTGDKFVIGRSICVSFGDNDAETFRRTSGGWNQVSLLLPMETISCNQFGASISIDGDRLAVSVPKDYPDDQTYGWEGKGSVHFQYRVGGVCSLTDRVTAADSLKCENPGLFVVMRKMFAVKNLIVGSPNHSSDQDGIINA